MARACANCHVNNFIVKNKLSIFLTIFIETGFRSVPLNSLIERLPSQNTSYYVCKLSPLLRHREGAKRAFRPGFSAIKRILH